MGGKVMNKRHILVVEDDASLLAGIQEVLELSDYQVSVAANGEEALKLLETCPSQPDLILSDIGMPGMDGYQFLKAVRSHPEWLSIPFIFLSARGDKADIRRGKLDGADDYISKPFEFEDLLVTIQARMARHEELIEAQESRLQVLKRRILHVLNHEFRTPLSYVVSYADLMATSQTFEHSQELRQYINGILYGSERLSSLIESFLVLAELESGFGQRVYDYRRAVIPAIERLVENVVEAARPIADEQDVTLSLRICKPLPELMGDAAYLEIALRQLVENAIKFSPHGQKADVIVEVAADGKYVQVSVCDQGRGITAEEQQKLFDIFHQVDREKLEQQGIGAGLAIVWHITQLHKGEIVVESTPGKGSCFRLRLPTTDSSESTVPEEGSAQKGS